MATKDLQKVATTSENIENDNLQKLRRIFPNFFKDGQIDSDALRAFLKKDGVLAEGEKYGLNWAGKSNAFRAMRTPATGTLVPQMMESKNWDSTENIFIEGDNLEVLKLLQKNYREKIKMIYIDPPYNTGKDFVYKDNFTQNIVDYYEQTGQTKGGIKMIANTEKNGRYHSDWLTMMYPRLFLAKNLLKEDGVIFVSIGDEELANLRLIMDEIFGEENFVSNFIWTKTSTPPGLSNKTRKVAEYIICYEKFSTNNEFKGELLDGGDQPLLNSGNLKRELKFLKEAVKFNLADGVYKAGNYERVVLKNNIEIKDGYSLNDFSLEGEFKWVQKTLDKEVENGTTFIVKSGKFSIRFIRKDEGGWKAPTNLIKDKYISSTINKKDDGVGTNEAGSSELEILLGGRFFDFPKPVSLLKHVLNFCTSDDDMVLDFFAGSATTAHAVMDLNAEDQGGRKWICVQLPEVTEEDCEAFKAGYKTIPEISRERIRRAGDKIAKGDIGFKSYKLSASNYRVWNEITEENNEKDLLEQSKLFIDKPLVDTYDEMSVVYEILLKEGFDLNSKIEKFVESLTYYNVEDFESSRQLYITFENKLTKSQIDSLKISPEAVFVCFDSALNDTDKVNLGRGFNVKTI